ncbi:RNA ligase family protein [uncultured Desulfosarcina sp.]|uniref:RNA ligase family protein n=1 Tax=uncultured Desulfosarcina sp. TaxID=218289 RepID=UPI0029C6996D|nr:RNA ligase family protein [uncultured Desulfosarcina sp.]
MSDFFKFPSTPHLALLAGVEVRGDKVMSDAEKTRFLDHELVVEEKVDGANLGISFDSDGNIRAQNRGAYLHLPSSGQWKKLSDWLAPKTEELFEHLTDRYIIFGEWCYARHSVFYDLLPDWFLGFDVYDKKVGHFLSCKRRDTVFRATHIYRIPMIERGIFALPDLSRLFLQSKLGNRPSEGIYLRFDQGDWLAQRAKLVRPAFIQAVEQHWSRSGIKANRLMSEIYS